MAPLVAAILVVLTAVAGLPALLLSSRAPLPRHQPLAPVAGAPLQVVRSGAGRWFLNGQPIAEQSLAQVLRQHRGASAEVRLQASAQLSVGAVSSAMAWLRRQSGRAVSLDLPVAPR
jgi:biopolymer transport protein ExbD